VRPNTHAGSSVDAERPAQPSKPGRPAGSLDSTYRRCGAEPEIVAFEGYAEALAGLDDDAKALYELARLASLIAKNAIDRAQRIKKVNRPEIERGATAAGKVADLMAARRVRAARGRRIVIAGVVAARIVAAARVAA
jgi:hypothetical protein